MVARSSFSLLLLIGILGGFTTFSSFTYETFQLLRDAEIMRASLNAGGQLVVGLIAMWLGFVLANNGIGTSKKYTKSSSRPTASAVGTKMLNRPPLASNATVAVGFME